MNSMKIGTYQMDTTFGLYLPEYTIPAPAVQTNFVKIIGRDGSVDLSNALGLHYDSRTWSLDFKCFDPTVNWHTLSSQVMNAIHGKRLNFEFDDDPNYFWTGRVSVQNYVSNHGTGTLKVTIVSDPFKYAKLSTIVTKTASTGTDYTGALVTFNTANAKINDLSVTMQPIQDLNGYSSPWPAGGGVNKYPILIGADRFALNAGGTFVNNNGVLEVTISAETESSGVYASSSSDIYKVIAGKSGTYTYSFYIKASVSTRCKVGYEKFGLTTRTIGTDWERITETITLDSNGADFVVYGVSTSPAATISVKDFQIEEGSTAHAYAPYSNICPISGRTGVSVYVSPTQDVADATTYAVDWTSEVGTVYGGTLDVVTGVLTVDRVCETITKDSAWSSFYTGTGNSSAGVYLQYYQNCKYVDGATSSNGAICSTGKEVPNYWTGPRQNESPGGLDMCFAYSYTGLLRFHRTDVANITDLNAFKAAFPDTQICYYLATPLTYQLTAQEVEALVGTNNVWSDGGNVTVAVVTPETLTNNGRAVVPTLTASADMVLKWGNYSASVQQGTSTIPQLILENGANLIYIIGTGSISFTWQEASL